jgi:hypothetical protein
MLAYRRDLIILLWIVLPCFKPEESSIKERILENIMAIMENPI